jgi:hypothetical protein
MRRLRLESCVESTSAGLGSGIGARRGENAYSGIENVTIHNSSVKATESLEGSGLGTTSVGGSGCSTVETIASSNTRITARGAFGFPAIGSGTAQSHVGLIHFTGQCHVECQDGGRHVECQDSPLQSTFQRADDHFSLKPSLSLAIEPEPENQ